MLRESRGDIRQGIDPGLLASARAGQQRLDAASERQSRLLSGKHTEQQANDIKKEIERLLSDYQDIQNQIRTTSPKYAALIQPQPMTLKEIQRLLDPDTLLLEYSLGDRHSYLWAVTSDSMTSYILSGSSEIEAMSDRLYSALSARDRRDSGGHVEGLIQVKKEEMMYCDAAHGLSKTLLAPVAAKLGKRPLLIVADGALHYVPFSMLPDPIESSAAPSSPSTQQQSCAVPLVENHDVTNLPSAATLAELRREDGATAWPKVAAVFADPVFDGDDVRVRHTAAIRSVAVTGSRPETSDDETSESGFLHNRLVQAVRDGGVLRKDGVLPRLLFSRREANVIADIAGSDKVFQALDFDAKKEALSGIGGQYRIVH
ncbi:MAG: CHAT domain-containing protein, partial [Blastocatellia bacterium]